MFAARADQENAVHAHQTAAAAKPLNQGIKALQAKTPGNRAPKTPFKIPLNDENSTFQAGKSVLKTNGKGQEKGGLTVKKGAQLDKSAFVTPAGNRSRAPLGAKTTNARAFQTPAPLSVKQSPEKTQLQSVSPRLRRPKVKIHQPILAENEDIEERDIEYMPPKAIPLPDIPSDDEFGLDKDFPQFSPENINRGWASVYFDPVDDNGVSLSERRDAELIAEVNKYTDDLLKKAIEKDRTELEHSLMEEFAFLPSPTKSETETEEQHPLRKSPQAPMKKLSTKLSSPPTLAAKSAASALSRPSKVAAVPSYAAPTGATKARAPVPGLSARKMRPTAPLAPSINRHATASAASHSTLGYAKGRAASQGLKKPLGSVFKDETVPKQPKKDSVKELADLMRLQQESAEVDDDDFSGGGGVSLDLEDDLEDFQLTVPVME